MNRNCSFLVRLNKIEMTNLNKNVKKTSMSREAYIRCLLKKTVPVETPPIDYYNLIREIKALGNNMSQIAAKAHTLGFIDVPFYKAQSEKVTLICDNLMMITAPKKKE